MSDGKENKKAWQLFDVQAEPGEKLDIAERHPDVVSELDASPPAPTCPLPTTDPPAPPFAFCVRKRPPAVVPFT